MTLFKITTATVIAAACVTSANARDLNTSLWQQTDLSSAPEVVLAMDACLQDYASWQEAENAAPTQSGFSCHVAAVDPSSDTTTAIEGWMDVQFNGSEAWIVETSPEASLTFTAIGDRVTGLATLLQPAAASADTSNFGMVQIGLVTGNVNGCETGTAFSILVASPELGVPSNFCYDLSSF